MRITLINHASALLEFDGLGLLTDPWLHGSVFGDSWSLLTPTPEHLVDAIREKASHLYISHEHPDHFHPSSLRKLFGSTASRKPSVLLLETVDGRLRDWFETEGFDVCTVDRRNGIALGDWRLRIVPHGLYDSYFILSKGDGFIVNLNDAKPPADELRRLKNKFGNCLLSLQQFSFAEWPGDPSDLRAVNSTRNRYLNYLAESTTVLAAKRLIPFASLVSFSHSDNHWMNGYRVTLEDARGAVANSTEFIPMAPGSSLELESGRVQHEVGADVDAWWNDQVRVALSATPNEGSSVSLETIARQVDDFFRELRRRNNRLLLWLIDYVTHRRCRVEIWVSDIERSVSVATRAPFIVELPAERVRPSDSLTMRSESLYRIFLAPHGPDEFLVAGRFRGSSSPARMLHSMASTMTLNRAGMRLRVRDLLTRSVLNHLVRSARSYVRWRFSASPRSTSK